MGTGIRTLLSWSLIRHLRDYPRFGWVALGVIVLCFAAAFPAVAIPQQDYRDVVVNGQVDSELVRKSEEGHRSTGRSTIRVSVIDFHYGPENLPGWAMKDSRSIDSDWKVGDVITVRHIPGVGYAVDGDRSGEVGTKNAIFLFIATITALLFTLSPFLTIYPRSEDEKRVVGTDGRDLENDPEFVFNPVTMRTQAVGDDQNIRNYPDVIATLYGEFTAGWVLVSISIGSFCFGATWALFALIQAFIGFEWQPAAIAALFFVFVAILFAWVTDFHLTRSKHAGDYAYLLMTHDQLKESRRLPVDKSPSRKPALETTGRRSSGWPTFYE